MKTFAWTATGMREADSAMAPVVYVRYDDANIAIERAHANAQRGERARIRRALEAERDGPGIDWSDIDEVDALIDRVAPEG